MFLKADMYVYNIFFCIFGLLGFGREKLMTFQKNLLKYTNIESDPIEKIEPCSFGEKWVSNSKKKQICGSFRPREPR